MPLCRASALKALTKSLRLSLQVKLNILNQSGARTASIITTASVVVADVIKDTETAQRVIVEYEEGGRELGSGL